MLWCGVSTRLHWRRFFLIENEISQVAIPANTAKQHILVETLKKIQVFTGQQ